MDIETADDVQNEQLDDAQEQDDQQHLADDAPGDEQQDATDATNDQGADEDSEMVITIGDEAPTDDEGEELPPVQRAAWARMRKSEREARQRVRELEAEKAQREAAVAPKAEEVGAEPQLEDFEYDGAAYRDALLAWNDRKLKAEQKAAAARQEQEAAAAAWGKKITEYKAAGAALKVSDFDDAESVVVSLFDKTQQGILLHGPNSADVVAKLTYAIGKNEAQAKKLSAIKDPIKFAFAAADLIGKIKVEHRKQPPPPERQVRGTAGGGTAIDATEARLEAEADRTGNRTALLRYRKEKAAKAA